MRYRMFAGSGRLIRFIFRRDRVRLSLWIVLFCGTVVALSPMFETLFTSPAERVMMAQMLQNPAMVAIIGPVYGLDHYHTGAMFSGTMLLFSAMIIGIMNIFLITRHTRQDEEMGRLEVIRSLPVGRLAVPGAALAAALLADAAIALVTGFGLYWARADGMTLQGCLLFGLSVGAVGFFFAAVTALICQLTANNRTAMGLAFMLMVALYLMRAIGDIRSEALSLASPLGLILRTQAFVADRWWPVAIVLGIAAVAALMSLHLAGIRDLGRGLVAQRPSRPHASRGLNSALGLAVRLVRASALIWLLAVFILAAMYGSVFGDLEAFMQGNELMQMIFAVQPDFSLAEQFIALLISLMSLIAAIPVLSLMLRLRGEERNGYLEHLLGRAVSRGGAFTAFWLPSFVLSLLIPAAMALGFWSAGSVVMEGIPPLGTFLLAAYAYLPAIWLLLGLAMLLLAYLPDYTSAVYAYLGYAFVTVYLGVFIGLPEWMMRLTPFDYIPQIPVEPLRMTPLLVQTAVAAVCGAMGFVGYRRRDMK